MKIVRKKILRMKKKNLNQFAYFHGFFPVIFMFIY
jgi:hypothetical protein